MSDPLRPAETESSASRDAPGASVSLARVLRSKPVRAVLGMLVLAALSERVPALSPLRVLSRRAAPPAERSAAAVPEAPVASGEAELGARTETRSDLAQPEELAAPTRKHGPIGGEAEAPAAPSADAPKVGISDPARSLDRFFGKLVRSERHEAGAVTRIVYFGDSVVASDFGTGTLRRLLQSRFGDAGHGFVLVASAWPQYFHNDVYRLADPGFRVSRIVGPRAEDRLYGLGGVSFSAPPGVRARVGTAKSGTYGRGVSRFELSYLEQPGGGVVQVRVDGALVRTLDTAADSKRAAFAEIRVPDGEHELELLTSRGTVRLFGVALERDTPGVVLDAIGVVGARLRTLDESDDAHFAEALARRKPDLVAFQFGANESGDGFAYPMPEYHQSMKAFLSQVARAVPGASCLVVGAMDRARKEGDRLVTVPIIPRIVEEQRKVAEEVGCAHFDTFAAMGGRGSMAAWVRQGFGAGDYTHPTSWGAERLGKWLDAALLAKYAEYRAGAAQGVRAPASPSTRPESAAPSSP